MKHWALLILLFGAISCLGCLNHQGKPVKWLVALRQPNSRAYLVYDDIKAAFELTDETLLEWNTKQLSLASHKLLMWNDQPVDGSGSSSKAHSKGFLHFEDAKSTGMYFVHSIPHFVDTTDGKLSSKTRETSMYGQSLVCLTLSSRVQVDQIIAHIQAQNSNIYEDTFGIGTRPKVTTDSMYYSLPHGFELVTKTSISNEHPFEDLLTNKFQVGWLINTWARPYKPSSCSTAKKLSNINYKNLNGIIMKSSQDHSKWALSYGGKQRLVCIGDLNHMDSQATRGGSFVCREDLSLYRAMYQMIVEDDCQISKNFSP